MIPEMSEEDREFILGATRKGRDFVRHSPAGLLHSAWDVIFDLEAYLDDRPTLIRADHDQWLQYAKWLKELA